MKFEVYDKAKWHYDSKDMPKDLPAIAGATHIAFFVRWCVENDLMSREIEEDCAEELQQIKNKELDCRDFFFDDMTEVLHQMNLILKVSSLQQPIIIQTKPNLQRSLVTI